MDRCKWLCVSGWEWSLPNAHCCRTQLPHSLSTAKNSQAARKMCTLPMYSKVKSHYLLVYVMRVEQWLVCVCVPRCDAQQYVQLYYGVFCNSYEYRTLSIISAIFFIFFALQFQALRLRHCSRWSHTAKNHNFNFSFLPPSHEYVPSLVTRS